MSDVKEGTSEYLVEVEDLKEYFPIHTGFGKTTML